MENGHPHFNSEISQHTHKHTPNVEEEKDEKEIQKKIKYTLYVKCTK